MEVNNKLKEGKLNIRGILKIWSERYVVLDSNKRIFYYKSQEHYKENKPAGTIQIDDAFVLGADKETNKQFSFKLVHQNADKETRYFQANSEAERKSWMTAISTGKKRWLSITGVFKAKDSLLDDWTLIDNPKTSKSEKNKTSEEESQVSKKEKEKREKAEKLRKIPSSVYSRERLEFLYEQYEEPEDMCIGPAGIEKLCKDLEVDPEDVSVLIFAWKIGAHKMGYFEKEEFINGLEKMRIDTHEKLKQKLKELKSELDDESKFKEIYKWAFNFSKEPNQRALDSELAAALLKVLTKSKDLPFIEDFCEYLLHHSKYKAVNMDAWQNLLHFNKTISKDLSNYKEEDAWPSMFDEFVEWKKTNK